MFSGGWSVQLQDQTQQCREKRQIPGKTKRCHTQIGEAEQEESAEETRKELASWGGRRVEQVWVTELQKIVL